MTYISDPGKRAEALDLVRSEYADALRWCEGYDKRCRFVDPFGNYTDSLFPDLARGEVVLLHLRSDHGPRHEVWNPERNYGSEGFGVGTNLEMDAVLRLPDCWALVAGGNDFTGWGCQGYLEVVLAPIWPTLVRWGLCEDDRRRWNLDFDSPEPGTPPHERVKLL